MNTGAGFIFSLLTFFSMYLYFRRSDEFNGQIAYFHVFYQIYYSFYTILIIRTGSVIAGDVSNCAYILVKAKTKLDFSFVVVVKK